MDYQVYLSLTTASPHSKFAQSIMLQFIIILFFMHNYEPFEGKDHHVLFIYL